jgi:hypothetical protein
MTRTIDAAVTTASQAEIVRPVVMARLDFSGGVVLVNNSVINITFDSEVYLGVGGLGDISVVQEGVESRPYSISLALSGVPSENISIALGQDYQGRDAKLFLALLDVDHQLIADPVLIFNGSIDTMDIAMAETATISMTIQSRMADWDKPRVRRYNNEDQIERFPGDKAFEFVPQMVEKSLVWGR